MRKSRLFAIVFLLGLVSLNQAAAKKIVIKGGGQDRLLSAMQQAQPGDIIEFADSKVYIETYYGFVIQVPGLKIRAKENAQPEIHFINETPSVCLAPVVDGVKIGDRTGGRLIFLSKAPDTKIFGAHVVPSTGKLVVENVLFSSAGHNETWPSLPFFVGDGRLEVNECIFENYSDWQHVIGNFITPNGKATVTGCQFRKESLPESNAVKVKPADLLQPNPPGMVRVRGDLLNRMLKSIKYLDKANKAEIWNGFNESFWGADYSGRTLEAYSRIALSVGEPSARFDEIGEGLLARQSYDGAFHNGVASNEYEKAAGFWFGNARGMMGLLWAYRYKKDERYLQAARKLGDFYIREYFNKEYHKAPGSFSWVATECMYALYDITGEEKYLKNAVEIARSIPPVFMSSQHTHSYLLTIRGIAQIYQVTHDTALLNKVMRQYAVFKNQVMWPGGGIVEHLGDRNTYNVNYWYDEGCSVDDWLGLNMDLWRISKDPAYMDMVERIALNHLVFGQDESGGFCGDRGVDFVREGAPWPFCCAMHGARALSELTQYIAIADAGDIYLNLFYPSSSKLVVKNKKVNIDLETAYPSDGKLSVKINPEEPVLFALKVRIPAWSKVLSVSLNGQKIGGTVTGGYWTASRSWNAGDVLKMEIDMPLRTEQKNNFIGNDAATDMTKVSLWKGPRQLVYNQQLNTHLWKLKKANPALNYVYQTYETMQLDKSVKETSLKIGDKTYEKGLGVHAISEVEYTLAGQFKEFQTDIGVDRSAEGGGAVRFKVCVDGLVRAGTVVKASVGGDDVNVETMYGFSVSASTGKDQPKSIKVNIENAQVLRLVADDAVNGFAKDYADWGNARLIRADGSIVYLSDLPDQRKNGSALDWGKVQLKEIDDPGKPAQAVSLVYTMPGQAPVPLRFNYLGDLGYSLIANRPVLDSWIRLDEKKK